MVASKAGSVCYGDLTVGANNPFSEVWMQVYTNERFEYNFGSAIYMRGKDVPITIIESSEFHNNFGDNGASIWMSDGGGLYCKQCRFHMDK